MHQTLESERYCWCSHAIEGQDLMWKGWRESRLAALECQPLSWLQKSARSRSHRGTHVRACEVMEEIKRAYYPRLVCLSDEVMHDTAPTLNPVWVDARKEALQTLFPFQLTFDYSCRLLHLTLAHGAVSSSNTSIFDGLFCGGKG